MKTYKISRASTYSIHKPCINAYNYPNIDQEWFINLSSLEDLDALILEVGQIIMDETYIKIYDDYIE